MLPANTVYFSKHSELLVYDWSSHGDIEVVVEDIERINFDAYETEDPKMEDWRSLSNEWEWHDVRHRFSHDKEWLETFFNVPVIKSNDFLIDGDDAWIYENVMQEVKKTVMLLKFVYSSKH
jgi:NADH dehydrogenase (ubiquinone) 1 alpha subcomplex subunit 10